MNLANSANSENMSEEGEAEDEEEGRKEGGRRGTALMLIIKPLTAVREKHTRYTKTKHNIYIYIYIYINPKTFYIFCLFFELFEISNFRNHVFCYF